MQRRTKGQSSKRIYILILSVRTRYIHNLQKRRAFSLLPPASIVLDYGNFCLPCTSRQHTGSRTVSVGCPGGGSKMSNSTAGYLPVLAPAIKTLDGMK